MSFYASPGYLDVLAEVYFKGRPTRVVDVRIGEVVLRLLEVDGKRVITKAPFLDYHKPLRDDERSTATVRHDFAANVARAVVELLPGQARARGFELAPFVDWSRFSSFEAYRALLLERNRRLIRERERRGRRLAEQLGEPVFRLDDPGDDVLELACSWKRRQLQSTGLPDIFTDPRTCELLAGMRRRGALTASTLRAEGALLAAWIGFIHDDVWSGWIFAYDPALGRYSPGHQLLAAMLEESYRLGHRELDFSTGAEDYKLLYATHARLVGPVGRPSLGHELVSRAKEEARRRAPGLVRRARDARRSLAKQHRSSVDDTPARPAAFDTAPPPEDAAPSAPGGLHWMKTRAVGVASALVLPVLRRVAQDHVGGDTVDDALLVARKLSHDGAASTLGFWESAQLFGRPVVDTYLAGVEQLAGSGLDTTLSIKPPAMQFDRGWGAELARAAKRRGVRVHCDSHGPEVVGSSHALEDALLEHLGPTALSTTLPGRWRRSLDDAERAIALGLGVRVVKGQWPDPDAPGRDLREGYLEVVDRLAGRARHVGVATHEVPLAAEAIARLRAAGTPCELELLFGRPMAESLRWARENGVRVRVYVPFGKGYVPSAIGILRHNPQLAVRLLKSVVVERLDGIGRGGRTLLDEGERAVPREPVAAETRRSA